MKQFFRWRVGARIDESADVGVARRNDPVERGVDLLIGLQLLEPCDVAFIRLNDGLIGGQCAVGVIAILLRDRTRFQQVFVALGRDHRQVQIRLGGREIRARLAQLLIDLRCFYLGQQLAFPDMRADIEAPSLEITAGARVDRRIGECLGVARQCDFLIGSTGLRMNHIHARNGRFQGRAGERLLGQCATGKPCNDRSTHDEDGQPDDP